MAGKRSSRRAARISLPNDKLRALWRYMAQAGSGDAEYDRLQSLIRAGAEVHNADIDDICARIERGEHVSRQIAVICSNQFDSIVRAVAAGAAVYRADADGAWSIEYHPKPACAGVLRATKGLKLEIELVPRSTWRQSAKRLMKKAAWDSRRRAVYEEYGRRCGICRSPGPLECHERWSFDDTRYVQSLTGLIALCPLCHRVKHIGLAEKLARQGRLDLNRVIDHFQAVNKCTRRTFDVHREQAFKVWRERSRHAWRVEWRPQAADELDLLDTG